MRQGRFNDGHRDRLIRLSKVPGFSASMLGGRVPIDKQRLAVVPEHDRMPERSSPEEPMDTDTDAEADESDEDDLAETLAAHFVLLTVTEDGGALPGRRRARCVRKRRADGRADATDGSRKDAGGDAQMMAPWTAADAIDGAITVAYCRRAPKCSGGYYSDLLGLAADLRRRLSFDLKSPGAGVRPLGDRELKLLVPQEASGE
ncbi:hypothetical protein C8R44DRAFT_745873 [Mycena epipterygia]|nr:hypothetical protein C8R44DRAFT_745873 [Mycena epipterygia]